MAKALVIYNPPADPKAFDEYYAKTHTPIAKKIPRLRSKSAVVALSIRPAPHRFTRSPS
jgi:uncharacterized protein (TIGR02118 family)